MNLIQTLQVACLVFAVILIVVEIQFIGAMRKINNYADALDYLIQRADYQQGEIDGLMSQLPGGGIHGDAATQCTDPFVREDPSAKGVKPV
jgi:hypothetical protein